MGARAVAGLTREAAGRAERRGALAAGWQWYRRSSSVPRLRLAAAIAGWLALAPMGLAALGRLFAHDRFVVLIWADAFTFWVYLPAYAVAALAAYFRRWKLLPCAAAVAALHFVWVLPDYQGAAAIPPEAWASPRLRFFSANIKFDNPDYGPIMQEAVAADPDVLLFQEFTPLAEAQLRAAGLDRQLPYHIGDPSPNARGTAIYSRYPIDAEFWDVAGIQMTRATLEYEGRSLRIYNVHPVSPTSSKNAGLWNDELRAIVEALRHEHGDVVVSGDFNTTQHHVWYDRITELGMKDAHVERGRGNATTWPNHTRLYPEIRIDQVFVHGGVVPLRIEEGRGRGSDHRPMLFEVALLR